MLVDKRKKISIEKLCFFCVDDDEHQWIVRTCRKGWDEHVGGQNPRLKPDISKLKD